MCYSIPCPRCYDDCTISIPLSLFQTGTQFKAAPHVCKIESEGLDISIRTFA